MKEPDRFVSMLLKDLTIRSGELKRVIYLP